MRSAGETAGGQVAFVLGAGSSMGAVQAGMLRALIERGIRPDLITCSSVGALAGVVLGGQPDLDGVARLEEIWRTMTPEDLLPRRRFSPYLGLLRRRQSLYPNGRLRECLARHLPVATFTELPVPLHCVATRVVDGRETWFDSGPLLDPLLASMATPIMLPPVEIDGEWYIDGGTVNDVPVDRAAALGARTIFVLEAGRMTRTFDVRRPVNAGQRAVALARRHRYESKLSALPDDIDVHVLPVGDLPQVAFNDLDRSGELIDGAYVASAAYLDGPGRPWRGRNAQNSSDLSLVSDLDTTLVN